MANSNRPSTLGELKASGYTPRSVKEELRENLMKALVVEEKQWRVLNYIVTLRAGLTSLSAAAGLRSPTQLDRRHAVYLDAFGRIHGAEDLAAVAELGFPMMIKPAHEGSSIGLSKVDQVDDEELLDLVELEGYEDRFPSQLSGGQKKRAGTSSGSGAKWLIP